MSYTTFSDNKRISLPYTSLSPQLKSLKSFISYLMSELNFSNTNKNYYSLHHITLTYIHSYNLGSHLILSNSLSNKSITIFTFGLNFNTNSIYYSTQYDKFFSLISLDSFINLLLHHIRTLWTDANPI